MSDSMVEGRMAAVSARQDDMKWADAARFVDALSLRQTSRFDDMTKGDIKMDRLRARGLV